MWSKSENSTLTVGASGETVALASGASQTGFGRKELLIGIQDLLKQRRLQQRVEKVILLIHQVEE